MSAVLAETARRKSTSLGCGKKTRYQSERQAEGIRSKREAAVGFPIYKYACSFCWGWHLTRMKPPQEK